MNTIYICLVMQNIRLFNHTFSFWQLEKQVIQSFIVLIINYYIWIYFLEFS